ncbi:MAG TPA: YdcF family protein [Oscillatoriaceae cyanobacterium M7585_C2015_266]|nr:YdcF family protein [Oscillatoriaceae cyanobacterium M7585_C2015_266]
MLLNICTKNSSNRRTRVNRIFRQFKGRLMILLLLGLASATWFSYRQIKTQITQPKAMLVLGGATEREIFAAEFARQHPNLEIWVSSGSNPEYADWIFSEAGINLNRVHFDRRAVDTVTNFTTLVDEFHARGIDSIYLITSDNHMLRASVIGEIVLGSRGIVFHPIAVPSKSKPEPLQKTIRDGVRALLWVTTGYTGSTFSRHFKKWQSDANFWQFFQPVTETNLETTQETTQPTDTNQSQP